MNIITKTTKFTPVNQVKIPEVFFHRFATKQPDLDDIFGKNGFVPGMTLTLSAPPGSGKTTMLLQVLELIEAQNYKTAYVSGEEATYQLAFTCQRLGVKQVSVANMVIIEDIFDIVQKSKIKMLVLDSFPSMRSRHKLGGRRLEEYLSNYICTRAKELECVTAIVLHTTKTGQYKGTTLLPHSVDCNILVKLNEVDRDIREFTVTKNRFGPICETAFRMSEIGFSFEKVDVAKLEEAPNSAPVKRSKPEIYKDLIMEHINNYKGINLQTASKVLECSVKAQYTLRDLVLRGLLKKTGRGKAALWSRP